MRKKDKKTESKIQQNDDEADAPFIKCRSYVGFQVIMGATFF